MVTTNVTEGHANQVRHDIDALHESLMRLLKKFQLAEGGGNPRDAFLQAAAEFLKEAQAFLKEAQAMLREMKETQVGGAEVPGRPLVHHPGLDAGIDHTAFADSLKKFGQQIDNVEGTNFVMVEKSAMNDFLKSAIDHVQNIQDTVQSPQAIARERLESIASSAQPEQAFEPLTSRQETALPQPDLDNQTQPAAEAGEREVGAPYFQLSEKQTYQPPETLEQWQQATEHDIESDLWGGFQEPQIERSTAVETPAAEAGVEVSPQNYKQYLQTGFVVQNAAETDLVEPEATAPDQAVPEPIDSEPQIEAEVEAGTETIVETNRETIIQEAPERLPTVDYMPPAEVEGTTGAEVGELEGAVHQDILNDGPSVPVERLANGQVIATPATRSAIEAAEDTAVLDQEAEVYVNSQSLVLGEKEAGAIEFFVNEFEAENTDRLEGDLGYSIERVGENSFLFVPDEQPENPIWVEDNQIQSPITHDRLNEFRTYLEGTYDRVQVQSETVSVDLER